MEYGPGDYGKRSEADFVAEMLAAKRKAIFLWPLQPDANHTCEGNVGAAILSFITAGIDMSSDDVWIVIARYSLPHGAACKDCVFGPKNSLAAAVREAQRFQAHFRVPPACLAALQTACPDSRTCDACQVSAGLAAGCSPAEVRDYCSRPRSKTDDRDSPAADRRFSWWFHADEKKANVTAALALLSDAGGAQVATSWLVYCNDTVDSHTGRFAFGDAPACALKARTPWTPLLAPALGKMGVRMERCLGHVDDAHTLRKFLERGEANLDDLVALVRAHGRGPGRVPHPQNSSAPAIY